MSKTVRYAIGLPKEGYGGFQYWTGEGSFQSWSDNIDDALTSSSKQEIFRRFVRFANENTSCKFLLDYTLLRIRVTEFPTVEIL